MCILNNVSLRYDMMGYKRIRCDLFFFIESYKVYLFFIGIKKIKCLWCYIYIYIIFMLLYLLIIIWECKCLCLLIDCVLIYGFFFDFIEYLLFLIYLDLNESRIFFIMIWNECVLEFMWLVRYILKICIYDV